MLPQKSNHCYLLPDKTTYSILLHLTGISVRKSPMKMVSYSKEQQLLSLQVKGKIYKQILTGHLGLLECLHGAKQNIYWHGLDN